MAGGGGLWLVVGREILVVLDDLASSCEAISMLTMKEDGLLRIIAIEILFYFYISNLLAFIFVFLFLRSSGTRGPDNPPR